MEVNPFKMNALRLLWTLSIVLSLHLVINRHSLAQSNSIASTSKLKSSVEAYLQPYVEMNDFSGVILIAQGKEVVFEQAFGMANFELGLANTVETRFQVGSISKGLTAAAIFALEKQGKLALHDVISRFLPDYPEGDSITIDNLLQHKSGIPDWNSFADAQAMQRKRVGLGELVDWISEKPLAFRPGTDKRYSNSGYLVLAYLIETISGQHFTVFLREHVLEPIDMLNTGHADRVALIPQRASGYVPAPSEVGVENAPWQDTSILIGSGSLYSTAQNLLKWARSAQAEQLLGGNGNGPRYAWDSRTRWGHRVVYEGGFVPGFAAWLERYLDEDITIVFLSNVNNGAFRPIVRDLGAIILGEPYEIPQVRRITALTSSEEQRLLGYYQCSPRFHVRVVRGEHGLYLRWRDQPPLQPLYIEASTRLFYPQEYVHLTFDGYGGERFESLTFEYDQPMQCKRVD